MKLNRNQAPIKRESPLRMPTWAASAAIIGFFGVCFFVWWEFYPITWELFADYLERDIGYFKPDLGGFLRVWWMNLGTILLLVLFQAAIFGLGRMVLDWIFSRPVGGIWGFLFALGLGKGLLGMMILALGLSGILSGFLFWVILATAVCLAGRRTIFRQCFSARADYRRIVTEAGMSAISLLKSLSFVEYSLLFASFVILAGNFLPALQPEWFYDSLVYHMAVPEQYMLEHKIYRIGHTFFSNFPFLQEMQYMFLLGLGNGISGKLLHWTDGLLSSVAVYAVGRVFLGRTGALLAQAVFLSQPTLRFLQHVTMVELGMTFFEILATAAFLLGMGLLDGAAARGPSRGWKRWVFLCAWLMGFAQGTKYLAIFCSGIIVFFLLAMPRWWRPPLLGVSRRWAFVVVIGWASIWTLPWLGKNWLFTGNPVFPMAHGIFPTINWDENLYQKWMYDNRKYGTATSSAGIRGWVTLPLLVSLDNPSFGTFTINLFPLLFLPCLLLYRGPPFAIRFLALYAALYSVVWAVTSQQARFLFPMVAQAAVPAAFVVSRLGEKSRFLRFVLYGSAGWILLVCTWGQIHNRYTNHVLLPFAFGHIDHQGILKFGVTYYDSLQAANEAVPPGSRLLFLGGDESYYSSCRRICSSIYDRSAAGRLARKARSAEDLRRLLRRARVTHLLIHNPRAEEYATRGMFDWGGEAKRRFLDVWHDYGRLISLKNDILVFELGDTKLPRDERKSGIPAYFRSIPVIRRAHQLTNYADQCFKQDRFEEAYRASDELVRLIPETSYVHAYRAYARTFLKQENEAIADYEKAISLDYPTPMVYFNLALLLREKEKFKRALDLQLYAVKYAPALIKAWEQAFELAILLKNYPLAAEIGERALAQGLPESEWGDKVNRVRAMARKLQ